MTSEINAVLGTGPVAVSFRRRVAECGLPVSFTDCVPIHRHFKTMVRDAPSDLSELALVTAMQAVAHGRPVVPLPVTLEARLQHKCLVCNAERNPVQPENLAGARIGVRAYSQTTGAWVRAILERDFGISPSSVEWITQETPHVEEAVEPDNVRRIHADDQLIALLESGRIDAAIFGGDRPADPWLQPVITDADALAESTFRQDGIVPINHIAVVSRDFAERHPDHVRRVFDQFREARNSLDENVRSELYPLGFEAMRQSVECMLDSAWRQSLLPAPMSYRTFFREAYSILGSE